MKVPEIISKMLSIQSWGLSPVTKYLLAYDWQPQEVLYTKSWKEANKTEIVYYYKVWGTPVTLQMFVSPELHSVIGR